MIYTLKFVFIAQMTKDTCYSKEYLSNSMFKTCYHKIVVLFQNELFNEMLKMQPTRCNRKVNSMKRIYICRRWKDTGAFPLELWENSLIL